MLIQLGHKLKNPERISGFTTYERFVECPRKFRLEREAQANGATGTHVNADIGTLLHAMLALYHTGKKVSDAVFEPKPSPFVLAEANRMFDAYSYVRTRAAFGKVLHTELMISGPEAEEALGVSPFVGVLDMVSVLNKAACDEINRTQGTELEPGLYITDHKYTEKGGASFFDRQSFSLQFAAYQLAWLAKPTDKTMLRGALVNCLIGNKTPVFRVLYQPVPSKIEKDALHAFFKGAKFMTEHMRDWPNQTACFKYGVCAQFVSGACNRT